MNFIGSLLLKRTSSPFQRRKTFQRRRTIQRRKIFIQQRGIDEFYDTQTKPGEHPVAGRAWRCSELRLKSFSDLHKLWFVLLKEKNMLYTQKEEANKTRDTRKFLNKGRLKKVKLSMARIKLVLSERQIISKKAREKLRVIYEKNEKIMKQDEALNKSLD